MEAQEISREQIRAIKPIDFWIITSPKRRSSGGINREKFLIYLRKSEFGQADEGVRVTFSETLRNKSKN